MHENKPPGSAPTFDLTGKRVWVAGHTGMVGGALMRRLEAENCDIITATRGEVDLTRQAETEAFVAAHRPQAVFLAAAKVGGILANNELRGDFIYQNTMIAANVIHAAHISGVRKLLFLGSTCIYPAHGRTADARGGAAQRPAGAYKRALCRRQDRRGEDVPGLSCPVRLRFHFRHAHQRLWPRRQLRPRAQPRRRRADPPFSRGQGCRSRHGECLGQRARQGANSSTSTISPMPAST